MSGVRRGGVLKSGISGEGYVGGGTKMSKKERRGGTKIGVLGLFGLGVLK